MTAEIIDLEEERDKRRYSPAFLAALAEVKKNGCLAPIRDEETDRYIDEILYGSEKDKREEQIQTELWKKFLKEYLKPAFNKCLKKRPARRKKMCCEQR